MKQGIGTYTLADGSSFEGQWVNGKLHGLGNYKRLDGEGYLGNYEYDVKQG